MAVDPTVNAQGDIPYGKYLGTSRKGLAGWSAWNNAGANSGNTEFVNGPQGEGYYMKAQNAVPTHMGVPTTPAQPGIMQDGSYFPQSTQTGYEHRAGVSAPQYFSSLDENGNLKSPFQIDPSKSTAFQAMKEGAMSTALSPWAQMQQEALNAQTQQQRDQTNAQGQGATNAALDKLMMSGNGLDSGARALVSGFGARSNVMANQNIGAQQTANDLAIRQQDAQNKAQMLGQVMNTETGAQSANSNAGLQDLTNANIFSGNRYNQQMQAWGAEKTAQAQQSAAGRGGKK